MNMHPLRWIVCGSLLALFQGCAAPACPDGWSEPDGMDLRCVVEGDHRARLLAGLGAEGAFGLLGGQGTGLPPTGAGAGWSADANSEVFASEGDGECVWERPAALATTRTNEAGEWALPLAAGEYCLFYEARETSFGWAGMPFTIEPGSWAELDTQRR